MSETAATTSGTSAPAAAPADRKLRVLHLTAGSDAGGLSQYIFNLCQAMHAGGHEVAVAGERGAWHWLFENAPWPWIDVPLKGGPVALWRAARRLGRFLNEHPVDILHAHYRRATLVGRRLQKDLPVPMLYTVHLSQISLNWMQGWLSDFGDHTHVASDEARDWVVGPGRVPPERVSVIPHGIDPAHFIPPDAMTRQAARTALGLRSTDRVATYVGRLDWPKNVSWMLDVAQAAKAKMPELRVLIVGEGPHAAMLQKRILKQDLQHQVRLLGHQDPLPIYHASDALLLPSQREGFSLVCAEAMACAVPVLRTHTAGSHQLVIEGVTGRTVPIDRGAFVAEALRFMIDADALKKMGQEAARYVRQNFTFDRQLLKTLDLYRQLRRG